MEMLDDVLVLCTCGKVITINEKFLYLYMGEIVLILFDLLRNVNIDKR